MVKYKDSKIAGLELDCSRLFEFSTWPDGVRRRFNGEPKEYR